MAVAAIISQILIIDAAYIGGNAAMPCKRLISLTLTMYISGRKHLYIVIWRIQACAQNTLIAVVLLVIKTQIYKILLVSRVFQIVLIMQPHSSTFTIGSQIKWHIAVHDIAQIHL